MSAEVTRLEIHPADGHGPARVYTVVPALRDPWAALRRLADPVLHVGVARARSEPLPEDVLRTLGTGSPDGWVVEVGFLPGVTDNEGTTAEEVLVAAGLVKPGVRVFSSRLHHCASDPQGLAADLHNPLIEYATVTAVRDHAAGRFDATVPEVRLCRRPQAISVPLPDDAAALAELSSRGIVGPEGPRGPLGLSAEDFAAIAAHYRTLGRAPSDVELETFAQSWSEHCKHRIFAARITGDVTCEDGLFHSFVARATKTITARPDRAGFCLSVFSDNAGAVAFDDDWMVCDKVETHNSPSALDPYGGAMTGIVGVNRDILGFGLGARPIANRYGFCFGRPGDERVLARDAAGRDRLPSVDRIIEGVIRGVEDGGNQSGIPTVQGFVVHDDSYRGKPLVFCGTLGLMPRRLPDGRAGETKGARPGDAIVMVGGRVGKDGIHGATFSSVTLDETSPATAVQIGDPIAQRRMADAILGTVRDAGLYTSITDNGAGGLSSSVGEMARESGGAEVWLDRVPLKYPGLQPWEVWVSESQERMTLAVPPEHVAGLVASFARHGVEATEIGRFTDAGTLVLLWEDDEVGRLDMDVLHEGAPRLVLRAKAPTIAAASSLPDMPVLDDILPALLAGPDLASRSGLARRYDHEVQGTSLVKPLQGPGAIKGDASAVAPVFDSDRAVGLTEALLPHLTERDPYACAVLSVDLAVRRLVALGCDPDRIALLDNICWSSPEDPERVWLLHETMRGAHDAAVHFGTPFVSGKDSMYNDFKGFDASGAPLHIAALPTLLVSALGMVDHRDHAQTMDWKAPGDVVALMGAPGPRPDPRLGGSAYARHLGWSDLASPRALLIEPERYRRLHEALRDGRIASSLAVGPGGLAVALARASLAGCLGAEIDVAPLLSDRVRFDQALFHEGAGQIVLSLAPDAFAELEAPLALLRLGTVGGTVRERARLDIAAGSTGLSHDLDALRAAHEAPSPGGPS